MSQLVELWSAPIIRRLREDKKIIFFITFVFYFSHRRPIKRERLLATDFCRASERNARCFDALSQLSCTKAAAAPIFLYKD